MCSLFYFLKSLDFVFFLEYNIYRKREKYDIRKGDRRNCEISKEN